MRYSSNYNMNKPELSDQYNLDHWNENTDIIDTTLKNHENPSFSESSDLVNIVSGENLPTLFGKIKKAISTLITHIENKSNPHSVTKAQVGLGNVTNVATENAVTSGSTKNVTSGAVYAKIASLDASSEGGSGKYISAISETDGIISATATNIGDVGQSNSNAVSGSNVYSALRKLIPAGVIVPYGGSTAPDGWLLCNGQAISRTGTYAELFTAIGVSYGSGNGTTTFNVPDLRECAPVGVGKNTLNSSNITAHDEYTLGEFKDDQLQQHSHGIPVHYPGNLGSEGNLPYSDGSRSRTDNTYGVTGSNSRSGTVTRGKRLGVNYIIKY